MPPRQAPQEPTSPNAGHFSVIPHVPVPCQTPPTHTPFDNLPTTAASDAHRRKRGRLPPTTPAHPTQRHSPARSGPNRRHRPKNTLIWQFSTFPAGPLNCLATPADCSPFFKHPVSSASSTASGVPRCATTQAGLPSADGGGEPDRFLKGGQLRLRMGRHVGLTSWRLRFEIREEAIIASNYNYGRTWRRYKRRWKIERLFAWLQT